jgi:hypothetical protein
MTSPAPKVFVSYSHDSEPHKDWVLALATRLVGRRKIPASDFDRLSDMVLSVFLGDLRDLAKRGSIEDVTESRRFALQASGFLAWEVDAVYAGGGASLKWSITAEGSTILAHCPPGNSWSSARSHQGADQS